MKWNFEWRLGPTQSGITGYLLLDSVEVLFLGSSHTRQGIDVRKIMEVSHRDAFALAYNGMDPASHLLLMKELLTLTPIRPKQIIVEAYVFSYGRDPKLSDTRIFSHSPPGLKYKLLEGVVFCCDRSWSFQRSFELTVSSGIPSIFSFPISRWFADRLSYRGSYTRKFLPGMSPDRFLKVRNEAYSANIDSLELKAAQIRALKGIFEFAKTENIKVHFMETPMPHDVLNIPEVENATRDLREIIEGAGFRYINFGLDGSFDTTNPDLFVDWNHLSTNGRELHSKMIGDLLPSL